jgi:predicted nucleotide-binding protein (sugar kinase/HSP70/actin superfamily)
MIATKAKTTNFKYFFILKLLWNLKTNVPQLVVGLYSCGGCRATNYMLFLIMVTKKNLLMN